MLPDNLLGSRDAGRTPGLSVSILPCLDRRLLEKLAFVRLLEFGIAGRPADEHKFAGRHLDGQDFLLCGWREV